MKRSLMKYRIDNPNAPGATPEGITYTARQLYEKHKRKMRKAGKESRY